MKVEHLISIVWSEAELKEALLRDMEAELNNCIPGSKEYIRREIMIEHVKKNMCSMEWVDGTKFVLSSDGIATVEDF